MADGTCPPPLWPRVECVAMGRCPDCGWHRKTQGHHENCPTREELTA